MRLTLKITIAALLGMVLIFSAHSYLSIQRERTQLKNSLSREARHLGESLRVMLSDIMQVRGEAAAINFLERISLVNAQLRVRWVWLDGYPPRRYKPSLPDKELEPLHNGQTVTLLAGSDEGRDFLLTYLPLLSDTGRLGAIEVSEPMDELHGYVQESLKRSALMVAVTIGSGLLLMGVLGSILINRPVRRLTEQAERIGTGDFTTSVDISGSDELSGLASTIERMRGQLAEAREAEQSAVEAKLEALEKLRHTERLATIGRLSAGMAHELGTPLNVISGRAKLIAGQDLGPEDTERSALIISDQADRMTAIMRKLLDFARRGEPQKQSIELTDLIKGITEMLQTTASKLNVRLSAVHATPGIKVLADHGQLQQVLLNLVMNGIQAMPDGGEVQIATTIAKEVTPPESIGDTEDTWIRIDIKDQGKGIPPQDLPHIFDPFFTTKDVGEGTGLGLSIAYGIIEEHGGWIEVNSTPNQGCCFSIFIPTSPGEETA